MNNPIKNAAARAGSGAGILLQLALYLLTPWGIYWSFHRHGTGQGFLSIFLPPLAWYRGVAAIWEKPAWEDVWDENTEVLGYVIAQSCDPQDTGQMVELAKAKAGLRKWIGAMPERRRAELRLASENYVNAFAQQGRNLVSDLLDGAPLRSSSDPSVAVFVEKFKNVRGLARVWKTYDQNTSLAMAQLQDSLRKASPEQRAELFRKKQLGIQGVESGTVLGTAAVNELFGK